MKIDLTISTTAFRNALILVIVLCISGCAGVSGVVETAESSNDQEVDESSVETDSQENKQFKYDTRYVDQLTLPRVAAPIVTGANLQTTATVGRNTQASVNTPKGASAQSNLGFFPSLSIGASSTTNPSRIGSSGDESDSSLRIVPVLKYRGAIKNRHVYELTASASSESFDELNNLDSDNLQLGAAIKLDITKKLQADVFASRAQSSDPRSSTATRVLDSQIQNDEFTEDSVGGRVTIGRRTNPLQFVLGVEHSELDFTNNNQDQRDRTNDILLAGVYLNVGPKTSVFLKGTQDEIDYESGVSASFDSTNRSVNIGVGWEPSYTTSVLAQAGRIEKDFEASGFADQDSNSFLGKLTWLPTEFTSLNLYTSKTFEESTDRSSPVTISELVGVNLEHAFTDALRAQVFVNFIEDELVNFRQDETTDYGLGLFYDFTKWLSLGASWSRTERESSDPSANFDSDTFSITASIKSKIGGAFGEPEIQTSEGLRTSP